MSRSLQQVRIVHLIPEDGLGGVETAARAMASRVGLDCEFHLLSMVGKSFAPNLPNVMALGARSTNSPFTQLMAARRVLDLAPDVLICSLWKSIPAAIIAKMLRPKIKLVSFLHFAERVHGPDRLLHRALMHFADQVWVDSRATLVGGQGLTKGLPTRIISFVLDRSSQSPSELKLEPKFVSWGRIHRQKGIDRSIKLLALLVERGIDARFDVYGPDQGPRAELERLAESLGIADRVRFHGGISHADIAAVASKHSFLLQLSHLEGMAMVVVEAMQLGLIPVVTPVGEIASYCREGENALIVDAANLGNAADRIAKLLDAPDDYRRISRAAREQWEKSSLYADDVCTAAQELVGARPT